KPIVPTDEVAKQIDDFCKGAWNGAKIAWRKFFGSDAKPDEGDDAEKKRCSQQRSTCSASCSATLPTYTNDGAPFYRCMRACMEAAGCEY
ncbi:hypothetical protein, partial [Chitinimonas sp.]|uniref:hypothetical protein n=1 Tax=Chitinimonas sp. TaxID=1934313 RepID=UPI002F939506